MTTVCFLSSDFSILYGPIDDFLSLSWTERYRECGSFSLALPMTRELLSAAEAAEYVSVSGHRGLGRIEKIRYATDADIVYDGTAYGTKDSSESRMQGGALYVSGRMAESVLEDRIIMRGTRVTDELVNAIKTQVAVNCIAPLAGDRAISSLRLGTCEALTDAEGASYTVDDTPGGKQLDIWVREILSLADASYRILPDYETGKLVFEIYRGLDRRASEGENTPCVFSSSFDAVGAVRFVYDKSEYKNYAFIAGEGEGEDRVTLTLDLRKTPEEPLRELYVDARDLRSTENGTSMGDDAYRSLLLARARKRLMEHALTEHISGETIPAPTVYEAPPADTLPPVGVRYGSMLRAGIDYALGDLCDIASDTLFTVWSARITEIVYTYEGKRCLTEVHFGEGYPDMKTYIRRIAQS